MGKSFRWNDPCYKLNSQTYLILPSLHEAHEMNMNYKVHTNSSLNLRLLKWTRGQWFVIVYLGSCTISLFEVSMLWSEHLNAAMLSECGSIIHLHTDQCITVIHMARFFPCTLLQIISPSQGALIMLPQSARLYNLASIQYSTPLLT